MFNNPWISSTTEPGTPNHGLVKTFSDFRDHEKIEAIESLISGKRICIVGPAPNLKGSDSGILIDSYDVVVRVNQKFQMSDDQKKDYGKRCDILIGSFNENNIKECFDNLQFLMEQKLIIGVMPNKGYKPIERFSEFLDSKGVKNYFLNDRYIYKVFREVGTVVNSGLMSIILLMNYDVKEIYVTGFTFYNMGKFGKIYNDEYFNSVVTSGKLNLEKQEDYAKRNDFLIHDIKSQIRYFSSLWKENNHVIKLDGYLKENLPL
jgi:hypothetical protein